MLKQIDTFRAIEMEWLHFACEKDMDLGGTGTESYTLSISLTQNSYIET